MGVVAAILSVGHHDARDVAGTNSWIKISLQTIPLSERLRAILLAVLRHRVATLGLRRLTSLPPLKQMAMS
jgi:hypothetical protein